MTVNKTGLLRLGIRKCFFIMILFFTISSTLSCSYVRGINQLATLEKQVTVEWIYTPSTTPTATFTPLPSPTPTTSPIPTPLGGGHGRLAFTGYNESQKNANIYSMNIDGTDVLQLTNSNMDYSPVWSPDGRKLVFISGRDAPTYTKTILFRTEIYIMNTDGSDQKRLTFLTKGTQLTIQDPTWSPDGNHIAFTEEDLTGVYPHRPKNIFVMNTDGSGITQLTFTNQDSNPLWSLDGKHIAFFSEPLTGWKVARGQVFVMNPDGSNRTQITSSSEGMFRNTPFAWSPDSHRIAFTSERLLLIKSSYIDLSGNPVFLDYYYDEIWTVNWDGTDPYQVTHVTEENPPKTCFGSRNGSWSPDGLLLTANCGLVVTMGGDLYTISADALAEQEIFRLPFHGTDPSWQP